jgi:acetylornithine deacetylase/succinyl-diaminopimelate desuccinylase-like protein
LIEYIRIPNKSPAFDPDWSVRGYMDEAVALFERWARFKLPSLPGATLEIVRLPGRTPVIVIDIPGEGEDPVLLYGHLDKQPEMRGWTEGYGPWIPRLEGDKLYGRGGADDGLRAPGSIERQLAFGAAPAYMGEGGSIPFMAMLGEKFPQAQFVVTGVLGPHSNAHGPNEFLHIPTARRIALVIAQVLADHGARSGRA